MNLEQARAALADGTAGDDARVQIAVWLSAEEAITLADQADLEHTSLSNHVRDLIDFPRRTRGGGH